MTQTKNFEVHTKTLERAQHLLVYDWLPSIPVCIPANHEAFSIVCFRRPIKIGQDVSS